MTKRILIAGGTGLIGRELTRHLRNVGHTVDVLTRNPKNIGEYSWNPEANVLDYPFLSEVQILINLSGAGITDARWTEARKKELIQSRVGTNEFLFNHSGAMTSLEQFICSSGINAYGFQGGMAPFKETDPFGSDFVSELVRNWEISADRFSGKCKVCKIRTAVVLAKDGGALKKMLPPIKMGLGSPIGSGKQVMSWIHSEDLIAIFEQCILQQLDGSYNALASNASNATFMKTLAEVLKKPFFFPNVPPFLMKLMFGEMAVLLLHGAAADNQKIRSTGFEFKYPDLKLALSNLLLGNHDGL